MSVFAFVVRRLRWLARVPGLPQFFDTALLVWTQLAHPERSAAMAAIEKAALRIPGIRLRVHRLGGVEFSQRERELGHIHGHGLLDVFVGRQNRDALFATGRAQPHHIFPRSGWVSLSIESDADVPAALALLDVASRFLGTR